MTASQENLEIQVVPDNDASTQAACQFAETAVMPPHTLRAYNDHTRRRREDELIVQFLPLVHRIVHQVAAYLQPPLSRDDLISAGTIGLVKAARDFDPTKDAEFKTYAYIRIRGAIIDELRSWSFAPPTVKKLFDQAQEFVERCLQENGTTASDEQIAKALDLPLEKLYQVYETARARHFLSISGADDDAPALGDFLAAPPDNTPSSRMERQEIKKGLAEAIKELPEKQRQIILLYYHRELTMKQVSEVMELTESRISQLHAAALFKLSVRMKQWRQDASADSEREPEEALRSL
jgi:RNA polymerase sigma factor for flagellar operon FliA